MLETEAYGFDKVMAEQQELGTKVRAALESRGVISVAAEGFHAPGVVVSYTSDPEVKSGAKFAAAGMQIAGGVPLQVDEGDDFSTFRLGLFGLDKLHNVDRTVDVVQLVKAEQPEAEGREIVSLIHLQRHATGDLHTGGGELGAALHLRVARVGHDDTWRVEALGGDGDHAS